MNAPFNGWDGTITVQTEDSFNGASTATIYSLVGKTRFAQQPNFQNKKTMVDLFRNQTSSTNNSLSFSGTIEMEMGLNAVVATLFSSFFELISTTTVGGTFTQYLFRPVRIAAQPSLRLSIAYSNSLYWVYGGVVIDSITFILRRNQIPSLSIAFKAASLNQSASNAFIASAMTVSKNLLDHTFTQIKFDTVQNLTLTELNLVFTLAKTLEAYTSAGIATSFSSSNFTFNGNISEYFNPASQFPGFIVDQADHAFYFLANDPAGTSRSFEVNWPRTNYSDAFPDGTSKDDLAYRANFIGLQDTKITTEATIKLII